MVFLVNSIPDAKFFLKDKDGYYNVTLIGTLIAGIALIINTNELARKAKEEQERYEKDRFNERERYNRETRRQLEKERIDRLQKAFYEYYKILYESVVRYDEMIRCLEGISYLERKNEDDINNLLAKEMYIRQFSEALTGQKPAYTSRVYLAGRELVWQIADEKDRDNKLGKDLEREVMYISGIIRRMPTFDIGDTDVHLKNPQFFIEMFQEIMREMEENLESTVKSFKKYLDEELKSLES